MNWITFLLTIILAWAAFTYNRLIRQRNTVEEAWAGIDVQLTRRFDLIPNLVELVKGYKEFEADTLEKITAMRAETTAPVSERAQSETRISGQMKKLIALAEAYPELKADKNFRQLHQSLVEVEDQLQYSRRYYNGAVRDNNNLVESFPSNLLAHAFSFSSAEFFEIEFISQRKLPKVAL